VRFVIIDAAGAELFAFTVAAADGPWLAANAARLQTLVKLYNGADMLFKRLDA
jgi:hypothetical protein